MPVKELAKESGAPPKLRDYVANMAYVGVLAQMLEIDMTKIRDGDRVSFQREADPDRSEHGCDRERPIEWAKENLEKTDPYCVSPLNLTEGYVMSDGNTAGCSGINLRRCAVLRLVPDHPGIYAGRVADRLYSRHCGIISPRTARPTPSSRRKMSLAAIGMSIGAGWSGLRSMTSTSGPGISLMTEFVGLAYYSEIPVVIWNVQRVGPSTGMPTRTAQGDLTQAYFLGHGDTQHIILLPSSVHECFEFGWKSLDIAERVQTPVFVLSDLDLGMNQWMAEEI